MATHKTLTGRTRNSTIPRAIVERSLNVFTAVLEKAAADTFRRMGTDQIDVLVEDPLIYSGILRELQATGLSVELKLDGVKPERVTVELRKDDTFRITRQKKMPAIPPPLKKR